MTTTFNKMIQSIPFKKRNYMRFNCLRRSGCYSALIPLPKVWSIIGFSLKRSSGPLPCVCRQNPSLAHVWCSLWTDKRKRSNKKSKFSCSCGLLDEDSLSAENHSLPIHNWKKEFYEGIEFVEVKCQVPFLRLVFRELQ